MSASIPSLSFPSFHPRPAPPVAVAFDAPDVSSDGGWLLLANLDREIGLTDRLANCLEDPRDPSKVQHSLREQLRQRVYQIAAGYEDVNDADTLRRDPLLKTVLGRTPSDVDLSSQPTLSRFENNRTRRELFAMAEHVNINETDCRKSLVICLLNFCDYANETSSISSHA